MAEEIRRTVLIVDDMPENIAVLTQALRADYRVTAATSGEKALALAGGSNQPDLILLDVAMPDMDGTEVCRRLKSDPRTAKIPVIFVTSKDEVADESKGFSVGAADYLSKPANPALLKARVKAHIDLKVIREDLERKNEILAENVRLRTQVEAIGRHDLKGQLGVIVNAPVFLQAAGPLNEKQLDRAGKIEEAGRKMLELINRTIDLYKMETGTYQCKKVPVNIMRVIEQVADGLRPSLEARHLTFRLLLDGSPSGSSSEVSVETEELLAYSLLSNVVKNAAEASPEGAAITVSVESANGSIAVHNSGAVPAAMRSTLFQRMLTGDNPRGSGLGAYSAQLIARTLGGGITFESSEQDGTTVFVLLTPG